MKANITNEKIISYIALDKCTSEYFGCCTLARKNCVLIADNNTYTFTGISCQELRNVWIMHNDLFVD